MMFPPGTSDWVVGALFGGTYHREGLELRDRQFPSQSLTKKEKFLFTLVLKIFLNEVFTYLPTGRGTVYCLRYETPKALDNLHSF